MNEKGKAYRRVAVLKNKEDFLFAEGRDVDFYAIKHKIQKTFFHTTVKTIVTLGFAIRNPKDTNSSLGESIAKGRAQKAFLGKTSTFAIRLMLNEEVHEDFIRAIIEWKLQEIERFPERFIKSQKHS